MDNLTKEIHWLMDTLLTEFVVEVDAEEIGMEAVVLGLDEVADFYVPNELFEVMPKTLTYEIMIVDDELSNIWVGAIAFYPNSSEWCLQVITKNGDMVLRNVLSIID